MILGPHGPRVPHADYADEDDCDHDDYDLDILTGRATCNMCDTRWYASAAEQRRYERWADEAYDPSFALSTVPRAPRPRFVSSFGTLILGIAIGALVVTAIVGTWRVWP